MTPLKVVLYSLFQAFFVAVPCIVFIVLKKFLQPFKRGFFCDDESINHPYHSNTISFTMACTGASVVPAIVIIAHLFWRSARSQLPVTPDSRVPGICRALYSHVGALAAGGLYVCVIVEIMKNIAGRHRPNFLQVCKPEISDSANISLGGGCEILNATQVKEFVAPSYLPDGKFSFVCAEEKKARESMVSFPSGHTAVAFYGMFYTIIYIQVCFKRPGLFVPFVQFVLTLPALIVGLSRISDYKHHAGDVVFGAILGILMAFHAHRYRVRRAKGEGKNGVAPV